MIETLTHAYAPLLIWTGLGLLLFNFLPANFPKLLGKSLYWFGVPIQIFVLARQTEFSDGARIVPVLTIAIVLLSIGLAWLTWELLKWLTNQKEPKPNWLEKFGLNSSFFKFNFSDRSVQGSFILAAMLGNTGFVGLAITSNIISAENTNWAVLFSVTNNVISTYGIAVFIASYFGHSETKTNLWILLRDVITVPSLWAFALGFFTQNIEITPTIESGLNIAVWVVIAAALILVGVRLRSLRGYQSLKLALIPSFIKVILVPLLVGLIATYFGLTGEPRFILVLMAGTPTALAVLILAEVYELDRELLASNIAMTTVGLLFALPMWLIFFA
ncbi:AEC family transporter [Phormidium sp. LEGE 05292]|uniref:AEC family transporter n=1 Tax=[Phormidium] sp. LEGE 05292 TaxID=767427 RepID=UPI0018817948|nr:AEC family transporter [Phormidium sp. LEGE 05292]MBE9229533.1 AEC family transporter [Phormidium sp. LEGE 05292]